MLTASEANRLANERIDARMKELLDKVEQAIRAECAEGRKNLTIEAWHLHENTRIQLMYELRRFGYYATTAPSNDVFIRWC